MAPKIDVERFRRAKLELYISPDCPYCRRAMAFYDAAGTSYAHARRAERSQARERMFAYTQRRSDRAGIVVDGRYVQSGWGSPPRG